MFHAPTFVTDFTLPEKQQFSRAAGGRDLNLFNGCIKLVLQLQTGADDSP